jgi:hypothetical protein
VGEYVGSSADIAGLNAGESVRRLDVGGDVGIPFEASLVGFVGPVKVLRPDGSTVGEYVGSSREIANPGGSDKFTGLGLLDGTWLKAGAPVGLSATGIGVDMIGTTRVDVAFADPTVVVVMDELGPDCDQIAGETDIRSGIFVGCDVGFTVSGTLGVGVGGGLFKVAIMEGEFDSRGSLVGVEEGGLVFFWKTNAVMEMILLMRPASIKLFMVPLKALTNRAAPRCTGAAWTAQKQVLLLTTNPS